MRRIIEQKHMWTAEHHFILRFEDLKVEHLNSAVVHLNNFFQLNQLFDFYTTEKFRNNLPNDVFWFVT